MNAYIYRAALYCEDDANSIKWACIRAHPAGLDGSSEDSEHWPQGPYTDGGGEADAPQHCDACSAFLENPLTDDGVEYVREEVRAAQGDRSDDRDVLTTWIEFYADQLDVQR